MSNAAWRASLKYSAVNGIIVPWRFDLCCLPTAACPAPSPVAPATCDECTMPPDTEAVDTYDWLRWAPEVMAGVENVPDDMAASFARRAAREFAIGSRALRREIAIRLQDGVHRYPLHPFPDEQVIGVASLSTAQGSCRCESTPHGLYLGDVKVDQARQELRITPGPGACGCHVNGKGPEWVLATVWAAPTEDSCQHDVFLYERYREQITLGARAKLFAEFHGYGSYKTNRGMANARGDAYTFARGDRMMAEFRAAMSKARVENTVPDITAQSAPASMWSPRR